MKRTRNRLDSLPMILVPLVAATAARGDIVGFGDFSPADWSINVNDFASRPGQFPPEKIMLTGQAPFECRSIFNNTRQGVTGFTASFTYQELGTPDGGSFGACFVIQNCFDGPKTVAAPSVSGINTKFGYSDFYDTFFRSVAVSLEFDTLGGHSSSTGQYRDGFVGGGSNSTAPLNLFSGNPIDITLTYANGGLHESMRDTVTGQTFNALYTIDIPLAVGGSTAYVGFTASTNFNNTTEQYFSNFRFTGVPEPTSVAGGVVALLAAARTRRARRH